MKTNQKINLGIGISIVVGAALAAFIHKDFALRSALVFVVLATFEWWYVWKLIKESDEPKPDWYPLKIALAILVGILLFLPFSNGISQGSRYNPDSYNDGEGDPQWGR